MPHIPGSNRRPRCLRTLAAALCLLSLAAPAWAQAEPISPDDPLKPDQVVVVYNARQPGAVELARRYQQARRIPAGNIVSLDLPVETEVSRELYDRDIAAPLRLFIEARLRAGKRVRALVSLYGMPLRVAGMTSGPDWPERKRAIDARIAEVSGEVRDRLFTLEKLADPAAEVPREILTAPQRALLPVEQLPQAGQQLLTLLQRAHARVSALPAEQGQPAGELLLELARELAGVGLLVEILQPTDNNPATRARLQDLQRQARSLDETILRLAGETPGAPNRDELYTARLAYGGRLGLLRQLHSDSLDLLGRDQQASLEGELAILLWPRNYTLYRWQPNPLRFGGHSPSLPTLMACRLDAPTLEAVQRMIDDAVTVERRGLKGRVYIDARGLTANDGYRAYDDDLRKLAAFLRKATRLKVVLDDRPELFPPNSCPDAALYCGWYSVGRYIDSFSWNPGAVGYHLASFEAVQIRGPGERWVQQMLNRGVAATVGPVAEPFLQSFPMPSHFFPVLLTGRLSFAETYYLTAPMLSWMQTPIGDPLYRPYAKDPPLLWADLADVLPELFRRPSAPRR